MSLVLVLGKSKQSSSSENQHSYSWYQNASESDRKPLAQTTTLKTGAKAESSYDSWDVIMGLRPPSPTQEPRNPAPTLSWASVGVPAEKPPSPPRIQSEDLMETSEYSLTATSSSSSLERNSNCRTYRRPNKQGTAGKTTDSSGSAGAAFTTDLPKASQNRGRTRDYTVLHPSSMSMCNVTIQDRGVEEFTSTEAAPSSGSSSSAGSGSTTQEAGWQRKKNEQQNTRYEAERDLIRSDLVSAGCPVF